MTSGLIKRGDWAHRENAHVVTEDGQQQAKETGLNKPFPSRSLELSTP